MRHRNQLRKLSAVRSKMTTAQAGERAYCRVEVRGETPEAPADFQNVYANLIGITNAPPVGYD